MITTDYDTPKIPTDEYFAGLFDGEGCIKINRRKSKRKSGKPEYVLSCTVSSTCRKPLELLKIRFGGNVSIHSTKQTNRKRAYCWELSAKKAYLFLKSIEKFLVIKRDEAIVAIEFREKCMLVPGKYGCITVLTDSDHGRREKYRNKLQELKRVVGEDIKNVSIN